MPGPSEHPPEDFHTDEELVTPDASLLGDMSREVRTSLDVILGYTGLLMEEMEPSHRLRYQEELRHIEAAACHLMGQVQDLEQVLERDQFRRQLLERFRRSCRALGSRGQQVEGILYAIGRTLSARSLSLFLLDEQIQFSRQGGDPLQSSAIPESWRYWLEQLLRLSPGMGLVESWHSQPVIWIPLPCQQKQNVLLMLGDLASSPLEIQGPLGRMLAEELATQLDHAWVVSQTRLLAETDPLTGMRNRRSFLAEATALSNHLQQERPLLAVAVLDIDHFKKVNDTWGHGVGDEVICAVAHRAASAIRGGDVFGRFGGEEFVIAARVASEEEALRMAERVRHSVQASPIEAACGPVPTTVSIGVSCRFQGSLLEQIEQADAALYEAKHQGRNRACLHR